MLFLQKMNWIARLVCDLPVKRNICLKSENSERRLQLKKGEYFSSKISNMFFIDYKNGNENAGKSIGIPRTVFSYSQFSFFYAFFKDLGFNVLLSDETSEETVSSAQEYSSVDLCFPMKLAAGHVIELVKNGVDYIFFPSIYSVETKQKESRKNYGCPFMQVAHHMVEQLVERITEGNRKVKILSPLFIAGDEITQKVKPFFDIGFRPGKKQK